MNRDFIRTGVRRAARRSPRARFSSRSPCPNPHTPNSWDRPQDQPNMYVDAAMRAATVESLATAIDRGYVFPDVAKKTAAALRAKLKKGGYNGLDSAEAFVDSLGSDLQRPRQRTAISASGTGTANSPRARSPSTSPIERGAGARRPPGTAAQLRLRARTEARGQRRLLRSSRIRRLAGRRIAGHGGDDALERKRRADHRSAGETVAATPT